MENSDLLGLYIVFILAALGSLFAIMTLNNAIRQVEMNENSKPASSLNIIYMGMCATSVLYSFQLLLLSSDKEFNKDMLYWGVCLGVVFFFSSIVKGKICADGIKNSRDTTKVLIYAAFPEFVALLAFVSFFKYYLM